MNPFYSATGIDAVTIVVSRKGTESLDIGPALKVLETLLYDAETVAAFRGKVSIAFDGYDNDPRELYEIPEVRRYFAKLDSQFPYWFYFLSTSNDMLRRISFWLCRTVKIDPGIACPHPHELQSFMVRHFDAVNRLFDRFGLDEAVNEEIPVLIGQYFFPEKG